MAVVDVDGKKGEKQYAVYDTDIYVDVNYVQFATDNWKTISSILSATGITGWVAAWWKRRRGRSRFPLRLRADRQTSF